MSFVGRGAGELGKLAREFQSKVERTKTNKRLDCCVFNQIWLGAINSTNFKALCARLKEIFQIFCDRAIILVLTKDGKIENQEVFYVHKKTLKCEKSRNAFGLFDIINIFSSLHSPGFFVAEARPHRSNRSPAVADRYSRNLMKHFISKIHSKEKTRKQISRRDDKMKRKKLRFRR